MNRHPKKSFGFYTSDIFVENIEYENNLLDRAKTTKKGFYQMLYIISGKYEIITENDVFKVHSGAIILSDFYSSFKFARKTQNADRIEIYFHPSVFTEDFKEEIFGIFKALPSVTYFYPEKFKTPVCNEVLKTIKFCLSEHMNKFFLLTKIQTIIAEIANNCDESIKLNLYDEKNTNVSIVEYVRNNFSSDISYKTLNEKFFISNATINKYFKKITGKPFREFLNETRLKNAYNLINYRYNNLNLREISELSGYKTYSTFYREFVKHYHTKPELFNKPK